MILLDTTFLIDFLRGDKKAIDFLNKIDEPIRTTIINEYELFVGIVRLPGIDVENKIKETKGIFDSIEVLALDEESMIESAKICGRLIQKGEEIGDNDCIIAGIALKNGISTIVTRNKIHFSRIPTMKVLSY